LQGVVTAIVLRDHAEAGGAAIHGVGLNIEWKGFLHFRVRILQSSFAFPLLREIR
jgi:hypothetical protein